LRGWGEVMLFPASGESGGTGKESCAFAEPVEITTIIILNFNASSNLMWFFTKTKKSDLVFFIDRKLLFRVKE
jgi:hypothetical protein